MLIKRLRKWSLLWVSVLANRQQTLIQGQKAVWGADVFTWHGIKSECEQCELQLLYTKILAAALQCSDSLAPCDTWRTCCQCYRFHLFLTRSGRALPGGDFLLLTWTENMHLCRFWTSQLALHSLSFTVICLNKGAAHTLRRLLFMFPLAV